MSVIQNYRYTPRILTFKRALTEGRVGRVNTLLSRFAADYRVRNSWGKFRHEIPHTLLVEGSIHHFDQLRNLAGADCRALAGREWNPGHPSFDGECCALYMLEMANDVRALYEGSCLEAGWQNSWHQEYYRAECEAGAVVLDRDGTVRVLEHTPGRGLKTEELPPVIPRYDGHCWLVNEFLDWLEGGPAPLTVIDDNMKSVAMLFAAIEASATQSVVNVQAKVEATLPPAQQEFPGPGEK
jgi:predicted dehydrogenase